MGKDAARLSTASLNPIDQFRDRDSYRAMLKAARNAAALDDLHDDRGAALIRLNFQATVLPDRRRPRAAGMVRASITGPLWDAAQIASTYKMWLDYLNDGLNTVTTSSGVVTDISANADLVALADLGLFELGYLKVPKPDQADSSCKGIASKPGNANCLFIAFVVPLTTRLRSEDSAGFAERVQALPAASGAIGTAMQHLQNDPEMLRGVDVRGDTLRTGRTPQEKIEAYGHKRRIGDHRPRQIAGLR